MKLNAKGMELYNKWEGIYYDELEKQRKERNDPEWIEGWCIIDDNEHCPTIEDYVGLAIFGDNDDAIYHVLDNFNAGDRYAYGYTAEQFVEMLKPYFDINEDDDLLFRDQKKKNALRILRLLREAQSDLLDAGFDFMNDNPRLEQALTLIGDVMDDVSRGYDLPIMSEQ